jgi:branched-chain amino acid transport system substrate-binding protein
MEHHEALLSIVAFPVLIEMEVAIHATPPGAGLLLTLKEIEVHNYKEEFTNRNRSVKSWLSGSVGILSMAFGTGGAQAQTTYNLAGLADFTGPYADIMKDVTSCRRGVVEWWNAEVGKDLGVNLKVKDYDTRYDVAQVASLWPGAKSELNPVLVFGIGGPDAAALQERLPADKVPMIMATAGYGYGWKPNPWVFNARPTYPHEAAAFMEWFRTKRGGDAPLKLGIISSEASPAYVDIHKGMEKFAKDNPKILEVVETIYTEVQPTDLTSQVNRLIRKGAEVIQVQTNTAAVVAVRRALQSLGKNNIPIMMSAHNSLQASGKAIGGLAQMEGSYEAYGMAIPTEDKTTARAFFEKLRDKYKVSSGYNVACLMGLNQAIVAVRTIESAAKAVGPTKVTGEAVRTALLTVPITSEQSFGILPSLNYSNDAPFPTKGLTVNIGAVQGGKYVIVDQNVTVPILNKW